MQSARLFNPIVSFFLRLGLPLGPQALLTITGRKSGLPRTTPVALNRAGSEWHLISVYGNVDWVRNLRAAGNAVVTMRRQIIPVTSQELTPSEAASVLRDRFASVGLLVRLVVGRYFRAGPGASLVAWEEEAARHPVFVLSPIARPEQPESSAEHRAK
ncbi:MAG: nitroreductase family deazaflavin-dependent oxidoreductase [Acidimicrobiia bacterium]